MNKNRKCYFKYLNNMIDGKNYKELNIIFDISSQINYINIEKRNIGKTKISQYGT